MTNHGHTKTRGGFSLLEIMLVIVVIGILAAVTVPRFANATKDARRQVAEEFEKSLENGVAVYVTAYGRVPSNFYSWVAHGSSGSRRNYVRVDSAIRNQLLNPNADVMMPTSTQIRFVFPGGLTATYELGTGGRITATYQQD